MSLATAAVEKLETKLPKVIDARTHGVIDYFHAAFFFGLAWMCRKSNRRAAIASAVTGSYILGGALLTDYPLGVVKVMPFEVHGKLDSAFAAASLMVPKVLGFEGTAASKIFKANALTEASVVGMTDWDSEHAREEEHEPRALAA
ncbi:MAG: hypothetical protein ACLGSD_09975 [Acidobacteriota bacterium]